MEQAKSVRLQCPNLSCRALLSVPAAARGRVVRCSQCGANVKVPPPKGEAAPNPNEGQAA